MDGWMRLCPGWPASTSPKTSEYPEPAPADKARIVVGIPSTSAPGGGLRSSFRVVFASCDGSFLRPKGDGGSWHPYHDFRGPASQPEPACSARTPRKNTGNHRFQDSKRYPSRRPVLTIWHGNSRKAWRNRLNSSVSTDCFSAAYFWAQRPSAGSHNANQALRVQAKDAITR
jgi:hypothetical protein